MSIHGLHHVTAIAGDARENLSFYVGVMGMRLVKKSVNQDVPDTYHLFYADAAGTPGTDLTFFPWPEMGPATSGTGLAMEVAFAVPAGSMTFWRARLASHGITPRDEARFGESAIAFADPHGLPLAVVEVEDARPFVPWDQSAVPVEHQVRGMHAVRLWQRDRAATASFLTGVLGFEPLGDEGAWTRFGIGGGASGTLVDVCELRDTRRGRWGTGGIHHVAFRVTDEAEQAEVRAAVEAAGRRPTPPIDRFWFTSVYFNEPGGVLFELATDGPGFTRDEAQGSLGERLILPPWLETRRAELEAALPALGPNPR